VTAAYWAVGVMLVVLAVVDITFGVRQWRNVGRPLSYWLRGPLLDAESRAGYDRGSLVLGIALAFFAIMCFEGALAGPHFGRGTALGPGWLSAGGVALAGLLVFTGLFTTIMNFNRPRFLVPPHLRGELGAIAGRRRRRRDHRPLM
jgi:hypothetical protein